MEYECLFHNVEVFEKQQMCAQASADQDDRETPPGLVPGFHKMADRGKKKDCKAKRQQCSHIVKDVLRVFADPVRDLAGHIIVENQKMRFIGNVRERCVDQRTGCLSSPRPYTILHDIGRYAQIAGKLHSGRGLQLCRPVGGNVKQSRQHRYNNHRACDR
jgi:hypothetical protein